jgi:hypothetical protein
MIKSAGPGNLEMAARIFYHHGCFLLHRGDDFRPFLHRQNRLEYNAEELSIINRALPMNWSDFGM